jgi:DNA mismatch endonuclease (patch repair protein)
MRARPDLVFTRRKLVVFVDGCFWHGCPVHGRAPKSNQAYWVPKLERNARRDRLIDELLAASGWEVLRVWEHTPPEDAAAMIEEAVRSPIDRRMPSP